MGPPSAGRDTPSACHMFRIGCSYLTFNFISPKLQAARAFGTQRQPTWPPSAAGLGLDPTSHLKFISPQLQAARAFGTQRQPTWPPSAAGLGLDPTSHLKFISPKLQAAKLQAARAYRRNLLSRFSLITQKLRHFHLDDV